MVGISRTITIQKQVLEEELASLTEEYTTVMRQRQNERDALAKLQFKKQGDKLLEQMTDIEAKLEQLEASDNNPNQIYLNIKESLPEIDFKEAIKIVEIVTQQYRFNSDGGAALFLLENSYSMAGYLFIDKIREELKRKTGHFKYIKVDLSSSSSYDEYGLLERVAGYLKIQCKSISNIREYCTEIIKKICQSLQSGSIVFIEINKWDCLQSQESIIPWFVDNFWIPLIQESKVFIKDKELRRVKFVTVIDSEYQLSVECNNLPYYCCGDSFDYQKILKLPLNQWQQDDIQEWLEIYTGLPASKIDAIAEIFI
ncbi:MAG: hypothetical protein HC903_22135 [Methylacidiphilales bacterium]|nr:hypothetical protein [Candidatus Methylacidiphilales bacterium]